MKNWKWILSGLALFVGGCIGTAYAQRADSDLIATIVAGDATHVSDVDPLPVESMGSGVPISATFQFQCTNAAQALTSTTAKRCVIVAMEANTVPIYWGTSAGVTTANGAELVRTAGDDVDVSANCSEIFCISANAAGEKLSVRVYN